MKEIVLSPKIVLAIVLVLVIIGSGFGIKIFLDRNKASDSMASPVNEVDGLIKKVGSLVDLPNETPTIATVNDKQKLAQYQFFAKAEIGDKVLIYDQAQKAYLYRPQTGKLIEVGPITPSDQQASTSAQLADPPSGSAAASPAVQKQITISLMNGTKGVGLALKTQTDLESKIKNIKVTQKGNAKNDYKETLVVIINNEAKNAAEAISNQLKAKITSEFPSGELNPRTDIVVVIGEDRL